MTARESRHRLHKETIGLLIISVSLTTFLLMYISLCDRLCSIPKFCCVIGDLGEANCEEFCVDRLQLSIACFGHRTQEKLTDRRHVTVDPSEMFLLAAKARSLRECLDESNAHRHYLRILLCSMRHTLNKKKLEFSALADKYYRMTNECRRRPSDTIYERGTKIEQFSDYFSGFPFQIRWWSRPYFLIT